MTFNEFVRSPGVSLAYLARNDLLSACELLPVSTFVRFCADRGLNVSTRRLESLERLGIFYPMLRVRYPKIKVKVERVDKTRVRHHGMLRDGEEWPGELQEENSRLSWRAEWISSWLDEDLAWDPRTRHFESWKSMSNVDSRWPDVATFYSMFQCYSLRGILKELTCRVSLEQFEGATEEHIAKVAADISHVGRETVKHLREHVRGEGAALLGQLLSARYYFPTQGDQRTITVPSPDIDEWDWWEFSRSWDAKKVAAGIGIDADKLRDVHRDVKFITSSADPLEDWYELVSFVALEEKERLKGDARFAQLGYAIEQMLRLFHRDLTSEDLKLPDESWDWTRTEKYGEVVVDNKLRQLEFLVNAYNLNPRPRAILLVEGEGEAAEIPHLATHLFGSDFGRAGVEVRALGSVDEFTGPRRLQPHGALEKLIDDYHARQTVVFVILDNENLASQVRARLIAARSKIVPQRKLTCPEYINVWQRNFEFDNFTDAEIASAMTLTAEERHIFTVEEVAACRTSWDSKKCDHLSLLYKERLRYGLNKKVLVSHLVSQVLVNGQEELGDQENPKRPIVGLVKRVIELAMLNHQPESQQGWLLNQQTGYFGEFDASSGTDV